MNSSIVVFFIYRNVKIQFDFFFNIPVNITVKILTSIKTIKIGESKNHKSDI